MSDVKPPLDDPRWTHVGDQHVSTHRLLGGRAEDMGTRGVFYDQTWSLTDEDGDVHQHTERNVNDRARTRVPPV